MATTNKVKGWTGVLMTEDSSFHWPTKRRHVYSETSRQPVLSSFAFLDTTPSSKVTSSQLHFGMIVPIC